MTHYEDSTTYYPPDYGLSAPTRTGYRVHSDAVWEDARRDYLEHGDSADTVCARYGLAKSTFRQRSREGGWRRSDHPDMPPLPQDDEQAPVRSHAVLAAEAFRRVDQAIALGRAREAASWMRLHERLVALSPRENQSPAETRSPSATAPAEDTRSSDDRSRAENALSPIADLDAFDDSDSRLQNLADMVDIDVIASEIARLQAELQELSEELTDGVATAETDHSHHSHPVFSDSPPPAPRPDPEPNPTPAPDLEAERALLLRTRERRLGMGIGTADLDLVLVDLNRRLGLAGTDLTGVSP